MSKKDESNIPVNVLAISDALCPKAEFNSAENTIDFEPKSVETIFVEHMPEGLNPDTYELAGQYSADFAAGAEHAIRRMAIDAMVKHNTVKRVTSKLHTIGRDNIQITVDRERKYPSPQNPDDKIIKHGVVTTNVEMRANKRIGAVKTVRQELDEYAAKALGAK